MGDEIEITPDEAQVLWRASGEPLYPAQTALRQLCLNLAGRRLLRHRRASLGFRRPRERADAFVLSAEGQRRLAAVARIGGPWGERPRRA